MAAEACSDAGSDVEDPIPTEHECCCADLVAAVVLAELENLGVGDDLSVKARRSTMIVAQHVNGIGGDPESLAEQWAGGL